MRVADYIFRYLSEYGVKHVFLVTGGGAMHLNDALKNESRIRYVCHHHEQGAAIAAEGYARTGGKLAVVSVTSGPGGTNALTGLIGQWLDSVPVLYLSGQVKFETTIASQPNIRLRQLGDQEINIIDIVKPVTKYAKMVTDPASIKRELDTAVFFATTGRPGPVWLDIPMNVQGAVVDSMALESTPIRSSALPIAEGTLRSFLDMLVHARRPLLIAGHGISISGGREVFSKLVRALDIPVVTTFNGFDLMASDDPHFVGRIGTLGSRGGNFALQNADLIVCLGTRNNIRQISYNWETFAKNAKKIIVDIDKSELQKKTVPGDLLVHADVKRFLEKVLVSLPPDLHTDKQWLEWCIVRKAKYPIVLDTYRQRTERGVHPYHFMEVLTEQLTRDALVTAANGTACVVLFQAGSVKAGQRIFWNSGCASMGYALPAAVGAAFCSGKQVVCIEGDGSLQMNLQELQTIRQHQLPIKVIVLNNGGYSSIRQTQASFFNGNFIGCDERSGVSFPGCEKVAGLYDMAYFRIDHTATMAHDIDTFLNSDGPALCEVVLCHYSFSPKLSSEKLPDGRIVSKPLEDLFPFLDRAELASNMLVRNGEKENE